MHPLLAGSSAEQDFILVGTDPLTTDAAGLSSCRFRQIPRLTIDSLDGSLDDSLDDPLDEDFFDEDLDVSRLGGIQAKPHEEL